MPKRKARNVRVAMIKAESAWGDVRGNVRLLESLASPLAGTGVDVVITPECFLDGYMVRDRKRVTRRKLALRAVRGPGDPVVRRVRRLAKSLKSYFLLGATERSPRGALRNVAYLLDRDGGHVGTYCKIHAYVLYEPGEDLPVFETDFGRVGIVICADRRWPENIRCLRLKGADLILNPTWGMSCELNKAIMRTRAYENGVAICFTHPRQSLICMADGSVGGTLESNRPAVLVHDIDLSQNVRPTRTKGGAGSHPMQNRRPELYGDIL